MDTKNSSESVLESLLEELAEIEHERWAHWQTYLHSLCEKEEDGSLRIPKDLVSRWLKQISTKYSDLSEKEKESDRDQVRRYIPIISRAFQDFSNGN
jgi:hypothetical protein